VRTSNFRDKRTLQTKIIFVAEDIALLLDISIRTIVPKTDPVGVVFGILSTGLPT
jgi:hypothetical protein